MPIMPKYLLFKSYLKIIPKNKTRIEVSSRQAPIVSPVIPSIFFRTFNIKIIININAMNIATIPFMPIMQKTRIIDRASEKITSNIPFSEIMALLIPDFLA